MYTIFKNYENSKTSDPHRLLLNLPDKINLKSSDKYAALSNINMYCSWKSIKKLYKNNKFKISARTWYDKFKLSNGSYSVSDVQDYFEYIIKNIKQRLIILQFKTFNSESSYTEVWLTDQNSEP